MKKIIVIVATLILCLSMIGCGDKTSDVDGKFMDSVTESFGADSKFNMGDHQVYYDDGLHEYIGSGSFEQGGISYEYNYRAFIQENTVEFVKITIYDGMGNEVVNKYDEDKEIDYLDSLEE